MALSSIRDNRNNASVGEEIELDDITIEYLKGVARVAKLLLEDLEFVEVESESYCEYVKRLEKDDQERKMVSQ